MSPANAIDLDETLGGTARGDRNTLDLEPCNRTLSLGRVSDMHRPWLVRASVCPQLAAEIDEGSAYIRRLESTGRGPKRSALAEAARVDPGGGRVADDGSRALVDGDRARTGGLAGVP